MKEGDQQQTRKKRTLRRDMKKKRGSSNLSYPTILSSFHRKKGKVLGSRISRERRPDRKEEKGNVK